MEKILEQVTATPAGAGWVVECSTCGLLGVASTAVVDALSDAHLQEHLAA